MADYFTHFSCVLEVGTSENALKAIELYQNEKEDDDGFRVSNGFCLSLSREGGSELWIHDEAGGDPECVIAFVLRCAEELDLSGLWGFEHANTCSRPRLEAFGGGANIIDLGARKSVGWTSTNEWLATALEGDDPDA